MLRTVALLYRVCLGRPGFQSCVIKQFFFLLTMFEMALGAIKISVSTISHVCQSGSPNLIKNSVN
jgi:hypothetical protein